MPPKKIEFYKHNLDSDDKKECLKVLNSYFLTTGDVVKRFENKFAKYLKSKYAVGLSSCTDALFLSLKYFNIGPGDEVITTPLSFIATANAIEYCGAKPVFVDVEPDTGNIDASLIEKAITKKTKAIIPVHLYGQMCDMKKIREIATKYKLKIIEDSAHCIEGERDGYKPGQLSDTACFSFYTTKNITSGEGGAIVTDNYKMYDWLLKARLHGMSKNAQDRYTKKYEHYDMEFLGYKANMTNIQAALLLGQLDKIDKIYLKKKKIATKYINAIAMYKNITLPALRPNTKHSLHLFPIWLKDHSRDIILEYLFKNQIGSAVHFRPIHLMKYYMNKYNYKIGDFLNTEWIGQNTISIPFYAKLKKHEMSRILNKLNKKLKKHEHNF